MASNHLPVRKSIRLRNYDYSQAGYYFVTICTFEKRNLLCNIVGAGLCARPNIELTYIGLKMENSILNISSIFYGVSVDKYVIMPNHLHMIIVIEAGGHGNPPLHGIIGRLKSYTAYEYNKIFNSNGTRLWQRNYHEHIIRSEQDLKAAREYIETNPAKWPENELFIAPDI